ncbi:collagen alpha-1(II) chain-like isoform X3 [Dermochelys coriacea]|uniref:collagen alpha-1(II) chain-like isoform X3 n=1 Tax=Dermochelys coriacea TaxID=27794 RepID=UPI001CA9AA80|nr:collagen alpha-1(II) chain-like isoform X3 [Dermochelys coriacea]
MTQEEGFGVVLLTSQLAWDRVTHGQEFPPRPRGRCHINPEPVPPRADVSHRQRPAAHPRGDHGEVRGRPQACGSCPGLRLALLGLWLPAHPAPADRVRPSVLHSLRPAPAGGHRQGDLLRLQQETEPRPVSQGPSGRERRSRHGRDLPQSQLQLDGDPGVLPGAPLPPSDESWPRGEISSEGPGGPHDDRCPPGGQVLPDGCPVPGSPAEDRAAGGYGDLPAPGAPEPGQCHASWPAPVPPGPADPGDLLGAGQRRRDPGVEAPGVLQAAGGRQGREENVHLFLGLRHPPLRLPALPPALPGRGWGRPGDSPVTVHGLGQGALRRSPALAFPPQGHLLPPGSLAEEASPEGGFRP